MNDELKSCPLGDFCPCDGDPPEYEHGAGGIRVACPCGVSGPWSDTFDDADHGWNEEMPRTQSRWSELLEEAEQLRRENRRLKAIAVAASLVVKSGLLCDPGCCGDDCGCDSLRSALLVCETTDLAVGLRREYEDHTTATERRHS